MSQRFKDRADGSVTMTMEVSDDYALRSWLLGFGRFVRVLAPSGLTEWIQDELYQARQQYAGDNAGWVDSDIQPSREGQRYLAVLADAAALIQKGMVAIQVAEHVSHFASQPEMRDASGRHG